jgi:hypothetical protein
VTQASVLACGIVVFYQNIGKVAADLILCGHMGPCCPCRTGMSFLA